MPLCERKATDRLYCGPYREDNAYVNCIRATGSRSFNILTRILKITDTDNQDAVRAALAEARSVLAGGGLVAIPTETVYGLAADATNDRACARIFQVKGRPTFNPLICHVADLEAALQYGAFSAMARRLAERFWPGPLTLVVPKGGQCATCDLVSAGLDTLALRVPDAPLVQRLCTMLGAPIAAPSANRSGHISPTSGHDVVQDLDEEIDLILDTGPTPIGLESTIVAVDGDAASLLRPGGLASADIEAVIGAPLQRPETVADRPLAPGMLASHYAPASPVRLNVTDVRVGEALLTFGDGPVPGLDQAVAVRHLSRSANLVEAAANLFRYLRELDAHRPVRIAVQPIPAHDLGEAINDRLTRAAAPRTLPDEK